MVNKIFKIILEVSLFITVFFLITPLILLVVRGACYIAPCILSEEIIFSIKLSMKTSIISTIICILMSIPSSYALYKYSTKHKKIIENILYTPMSLPHLVSGIALLLLFGRKGIGVYLNDIFNIDFIFTQAGIVLAQVFVNLPFSIKIILTAFEEINPKMIFISRTLGCNELQSFIYVILPSIKRDILSNAIMTWSRALGEFGAVIMVAGTTRMKTEVLPTAIFLHMATGDIDLAIGTACILIILSMICMLIFDTLISSKRRC